MLPGRAGTADHSPADRRKQRVCHREVGGCCQFKAASVLSINPVRPPNMTLEKFNFGQLYITMVEIETKF